MKHEFDNREEFDNRTKYKTIKRQNSRCAFCGIPLRTPWSRGLVEGEAHHLVPDLHGGGTSSANCVYLCWGDHKLMGHGMSPFGIDRQGGSSRHRVYLYRTDFPYWHG